MTALPVRRFAVWFAVSLALLATIGCMGGASDPAQIRSLVERRQAALDRGDLRAVYRLTDLDFRATCPLPAYTPPRPPDDGSPRHGMRIDALVIRHIHATAEIVREGPLGTERERLAFVRDGGRWYVYETLERCGGVQAARRWHGAGRAPTADARPHGMKAGG